MARKHKTAIILASLALAGAAVADIETDLDRYSHRTVLGHRPAPAAVTSLSKASGDTIYLMGGPDREDGKFESATGVPSWQGWTHDDITTESVAAWHISTTYVLSGARSMVCGLQLPTENGSDFGYGNDWKNSLVFTYPVANPGADSQVRLTGTMRVDTEPDYDFVYIQVYQGGQWQLIDDLAVYDGTRTWVVDYTTTFHPADYAGASDDEIWIRFYFESDVGWSDQDGFFDSDGACWVDNLTVRVGGIQVDYEDFEDGNPGRWQEELVPGVGDFAALYSGLLDLDPCRSNSSVQVAFVDNGVVVPGTGGSPCITWCYGPEAYIVNNSGGLLGPTYHLQTGIDSQPFEWNDTCDAAELVFGVYMHEPMTQSSGGIMYVWRVRSTAMDDPAMLQWADWVNDLTVWYGPPVYVNHPVDLTTYLVPGRRWFQIRLEVWEAGYLFGIEGSDGTPHPYFDNVRVLTYPFGGPAISYNPLFVAQDGFPASGDLDLLNLANNSIRFDMARNISPNDHLRNDPGDSLFVDVVPVRAGSTLQQMPQMVVRMKANPLFDGVRTLPPGFSRVGAIVTGSVAGDSTYTSTGSLVADRYHFDLPDTGFFYPGDIIHYFFEAWDNLGGNIGHTMLPGDTAGFASFDHDLDFPSDFICRGLPSLHSATPGDQPKILLWNDFADRGGENEWSFALRHAGLREGVGYDLFYTNAPDAGEGNGLGGRATSVVLGGYDVLLYTCGDLLAYTLSNGDFTSDPSQDIQVLTSWFQHGDKKALFCGDDLVFDLTQKGAEGHAFLNSYLSVQLIDSDVRTNIGGQTAPLVRAAPGNGVFATCDRWIAFGGCLGINTFDAVQTIGSAVRLAEFTDANGNTGVYPYAAASYYHNAASDADAVLLPYDLMFLYNAPDYVPPVGMGGVAARSIVLRDVLNFFGQILEGPIGVDPPELTVLAVRAHPNPFNPQTTLTLSLPSAGRVSVRIYSVRGELVRTLHDGLLQSGRHDLVWNGRDGSGAESASGVYFAETRALDQTRVTRLAMIK
ncbi:MAG TPA: FlgD immunoglobulin-like domain containing protein [Candidatus Krumholzibacteria bacterium]|nr:FlgD immunoglobulin-like domain containing protein [Candidatus Krumholzibacteria bacterium]HPD70942.1 FlgD immunoglobulin-like domain containing protein [Candidatus Krumholzibacteria bacterium]HRY39358.1 FlgD immunoglobulin-like domain containing protein [Candidatus Krumholzibacteria bacterium]